MSSYPMIGDGGVSEVGLCMLCVGMVRYVGSNVGLGTTTAVQLVNAVPLGHLNNARSPCVRPFLVGITTYKHSTQDGK